MLVKHRGKIDKNQELRYLNPDGFKSQLLAFKPDTYVWITIKDERQLRSLPQNAYYWSVIIKYLAEFFGYGKEEEEDLHDRLREMFLSVEDPGKPFKRVRSTTELDTKEFSEYNETIKRWSAKEYGVYIPDPNQVEQ